LRPPIVKFHAMVLVAQLKRFTTRASLQRPTGDYILTAAQLGHEWAINSLKTMIFLVYVLQKNIKRKKEFRIVFKRP